MDPDAALGTIRMQVDAYPCRDFDVDALIEAVDALDLWLSKGGFLPRAWNKNRKMTDE